jgi:hypothetical protein
MLAAWTLVFYGALLVVADFVGVREEAGVSTSPTWSLIHLAVVALLALGVWRAQHWGLVGCARARVRRALPAGSSDLALVAGPGLPTLVPTVNLLLVCMEGAGLVFLIALLTWLHREGGR